MFHDISFNEYTLGFTCTWNAPLLCFSQVDAFIRLFQIITMASKNTVSGDDRFTKVQKDPRFWEMPSREHKVKIDKRFKSMFHDERFKLKYTVDKRGRPVNQTSTEDLKRFYKLSDSELSDEEEENKKTEKPKKEKKVKKADEEPQVRMKKRAMNLKRRKTPRRSRRQKKLRKPKSRW